MQADGHYRMKHPFFVSGFSGSLEELANNVGTMRYDRVQEFLDLLARNIEEQAIADESRNRPQLASKLRLAADALYHSTDALSEAWKICKPYMKEE